MDTDTPTRVELALHLGDDVNLGSEEIRWRMMTHQFLEKMELGQMSDADLAESVRRGAAHVVEGFIKALPWSERATETDKALVAGNLRTFWHWLHQNSRGRILADHKAAPSAPAPAAPVEEPPLCDGCAQAWYTERNLLPQDKLHCVACAMSAAALEAAQGAARKIHVNCGRMEESNGRVTWVVFLSHHPDNPPWANYQVCASEIEGRARYEAARLLHFFGQGPEPDILAFDTDA